jgi:outer membrane lipase/esterase
MTDTGYLRRVPGWRKATAAALLAIAGCGGSQLEPFEPVRVLAFGDETSVITNDGRKYTVNAVTAAGAPDCVSNPNWVQLLARSYGMVFAECNPTNVATPQGRMFAQPGATVADLEAQIAAAGTLSNKDLATILIGANDVLEVYAQYPGVTEAQAQTELVSRANALAAQVNGLAARGTPTIVVTVPELGRTPFGFAERDANPDDAPAVKRDLVLNRLTLAFNRALRLGIVDDGTVVGLATGDDELRRMNEFPGFYGLVNTVDAACSPTAVLPDCTTQTLVTGATTTGWLWADDTQLGVTGHRRLAELADLLARNNPF